MVVFKPNNALRHALDLPPLSKGETAFHLQPTDSDLIDFIDEIHYKWEKQPNTDILIKTNTALKKNDINAEFSYVFLHFIQSLTAKIGIHDQAGKTQSKMVFVAIKGWKIDYAKIIFDVLVSKL